MIEFDAFRQDLATSLLEHAERRRHSRAGGRLTGEDIKVVALLEGLAGDVTNLDIHVFLIFELMFTHKRLARRFLRRHDDLLAQLGVTYCPSSATDLVRWLTSHTADRDREGLSPRPSRRSAAEASPRPVKSPGLRRDLLDGGEQSLPRSFAVNFSAGFSVVAPLLSFWNVRAAFGQMNDRIFMADHAAVPATVVSVSPVTASRSSASSTDVVLAFRQASGEACTSTWHTGIPPFSGAPGDTIMVVPRSASCGLPLIPSLVGDPMQTFALAAALMAGALASIKLWSWLSRRPVARPVAFAVVGRRRDLA